MVSRKQSCNALTSRFKYNQYNPCNQQSSAEYVTVHHHQAKEQPWCKQTYKTLICKGRKQPPAKKEGTTSITITNATYACTAACTSVIAATSTTSTSTTLYMSTVHSQEMQASISSWFTTVKLVFQKVPWCTSWHCFTKGSPTPIRHQSNDIITWL